jgi:hypothetical protein
MDDPVFSYCFKCGKAYAHEYEDFRMRERELVCPYCKELTHKHSCSWKAMRASKEGRHLPETPEVGKEYLLLWSRNSQAAFKCVKKKGGICDQQDNKPKICEECLKYELVKAPA